MDCYCDIHLANDDEFLLDDKNTEPLLKRSHCIKCKDMVNLENIHSTAVMWSAGDSQYSNNRNSINEILPNIMTRVYPADATNNVNISDPSLISIESHCHGPDEPPSIKWIRRKLMFATVLCLLFMFAEIAGGYIAGSLALMTDSAHMLTDVLACSLALVSISIAKKKPTKKYPFGYYRAEILGALFSIIFIWVLTGVFVYLAAMRLYTNEYEIHSKTMLITAVLGLICNIIQVVILHGAVPLGKGHQHNNQKTNEHAHNINLRAAMIHVLGDLLQSVGIVVAAIVIMYQPHLKAIDPICTFLFSIIVLFTTFYICRDSMNVLMEGFPLNLKYDQLYASLYTIPNVKHVHKLQVWSLTTNRFVVAVHLAVDKEADRDAVLQQARILLKDEYDIQISTIQVEVYDHMLMLICPECKIPPDH